MLYTLAVILLIAWLLGIGGIYTIGTVARVVKVILRNPRREVDVDGKRRVKDLLSELGILPSTVLVIRDNELLTSDAVVGGDDVLEVRPVMSGGGGAGA